jgi:type II secretory pathway pseudopilin PulG
MSDQLQQQLAAMQALLEQQAQAQEQMRIEQETQREIAVLKQAWGDKFEKNYATVLTHLQSLPDDQQALYNSAQGAQYLMWQLETSQGTTAASESIPSIGTSTTPVDGVSVGGSSYKFKRSELAKLTPAEYEAKYLDIAQAYQNGEVELDITVSD